jgi:hypothetical protein
LDWGSQDDFKFDFSQKTVRRPVNASGFDNAREKWKDLAIKPSSGASCDMPRLLSLALEKRPDALVNGS